MSKHQHINDELLKDDNGSALNFVAETDYLKPQDPGDQWVADFLMKVGGHAVGFGPTQLDAGRAALKQVADLNSAEMAKYT